LCKVERGRTIFTPQQISSSSRADFDQTQTHKLCVLASSHLTMWPVLLTLMTHT